MMKIKDFFMKYKTKIIIYVICIACTSIIGTGTIYLVNEAKVNKEISNVFKNNESTGVIVIYVKGAVLHPGVYELNAGARVNDAIKVAGGYAEDAIIENLNLAGILEDGQQLTVMSVSEMSGNKSKLVNINTAVLFELMKLPGIGESYAQKIIDYREKNGGFKSISEIKNVDGIGSKKYESIRDLIIV